MKPYFTGCLVINRLRPTRRPTSNPIPPRDTHHEDSPAWRSRGGCVHPDRQRCPCRRPGRHPQKGEIVIGTLGTDEPNSFIDPKTRQIIGYEVDLGTEIAKAIGVKPVFKQISVAARIPELQQGHVDLLAASLTHNKEREALVDFSYSIIVTGQKALVKKNAGFASLHDLDGKKVLTVKGGTQEPNIRKALPNAQVVTFETSQQALLALQQGKGQAFVDDESALVNDFGKLGAAAGGYAILPENLSTEALAIAFRKGNPQLKQLVDSTLAGLERSGAAEQLYRGTGRAPSPILSERHFKIDSDRIPE